MNNYLLIAILALQFGCIQNTSNTEETPNILFIIADDQSWNHLGCYGDNAVRTPNMDMLADDGARFTNAYCAAPSCSPSRASILTGQDMYRLEEGGILTGFIRDKYKVFPGIMENNGYFVGYAGKGYWPKTKGIEGTIEEPLVKRYHKLLDIEVPNGISKIDHEASFEEFLKSNNEKKPFFYWLGFSEPHIKHPEGLGLEYGIDTSKIEVPGFYPNTPEIKLGISDYLAEVEYLDKSLGKVLNVLNNYELSENTIIVYTSDNGMPFPRAKATNYDYGVRIPLIIKWNGKIKKGRVVDDPVSLIDLGPTFLNILGISVDEQMTGKNIEGILRSNKSGIVDATKEFVVSGFEKHCEARTDSLGYPRRAIHTKDWTYIVNYEPDRMPVGDKEVYIEQWGNYGDIDPSIVKSYFLKEESNPDFQNLFNLNFGKVPGEELYDKNTDSDMIHNLAYNEEYTDIVKELRGKLDDYLMKTNDPRINGATFWDQYYYDGPPPQ